MTELNLEQLRSAFNSHPEIKLAYLFGSQASGNPGPLSDHDFAFYLDTRDKTQMADLRCVLLEEISRALKTDKTDVLLLNTLQSPEMKYEIVSHGKLIFEKEPFKILIEPKILNEYFDFRSFLLRHHLTKS